MEYDMEFSQEILDQIRELHITAKVEAQRLKAEAEQAAQTEYIWAEFERFLAKGWAFHILALIEREILLKKMRAEHNLYRKCRIVCNFFSEIALLKLIHKQVFSTVDH
jgi:hypothetical protein